MQAIRCFSLRAIRPLSPPPPPAGAVVAAKAAQWAARWWAECCSGVRARRKQLQRRLQAAGSYEEWAEAAEEVRAWINWIHSAGAGGPANGW